MGKGSMGFCIIKSIYYLSIPTAGENLWITRTVLQDREALSPVCRLYTLAPSAGNCEEHIGRLFLSTVVPRDGAEDAHVRVLHLSLCSVLTAQASSLTNLLLPAAYPVETHGLYDEVHKPLGPPDIDESKPHAGLLRPWITSTLCGLSS